MIRKRGLPDGKSTLSEWPVRIWDDKEFPEAFKERALAWVKGNFSSADFVNVPRRRTDKNSFHYLFGYGTQGVLYLRQDEDGVSEKTVEFSQLTKVCTRRELLKAEIILHYQEAGEDRELSFPYVPSVYYLYDPFLNRTLGLEKEFLPELAEKEFPRPQKLYEESLAMYNFSLGAYRLGKGFTDYTYRSQISRNRWMPWKKYKEEWLEVPMEKGVFALHCKGYLTECDYRIKENKKEPAQAAENIV